MCGSKRADAVRAGRSLKGASEVSFDAIELDFGQGRCALLVDTIKGDVLTSGRFSYTVVLNRGANKVGGSSREFLVVLPNQIAASRSR